MNSPLFINIPPPYSSALFFAPIVTAPPDEFIPVYSPIIPPLISNTPESTYMAPPISALQSEIIPPFIFSLPDFK